MTDAEFIQKLRDTSDKEVKIMPLDEINMHLEGITQPFKKRGINQNEFTILNVARVQEFEGLYKIAVVDTIPPGPKTLERVRAHLLWGEVLDTVLVPIYVRNGNKDYFLLIAQDRMTLGRKISIEVNRGFVTKRVAVADRAFSLIERKMPYLFSVLDVVKTVDLGFFWENTGLTGLRIPVQALFCKTKTEYDLDDLKRLLKDKHDYSVEPVVGPPLHNNEPVIKSVEEVMQRLDEILENPLLTENEAYLNDLYSQTGLNQLLRYINKYGLPY